MQPLLPMMETKPSETCDIHVTMGGGCGENNTIDLMIPGCDIKQPSVTSREQHYEVKN